MWWKYDDNWTTQKNSYMYMYFCVVSVNDMASHETFKMNSVLNYISQ